LLRRRKHRAERFDGISLDPKPLKGGHARQSDADASEALQHRVLNTDRATLASSLIPIATVDSFWQARQDSFSKAPQRWTAIDFNRRLLTVEGPNAKNRQTRHVPLNEEAVGTLRRWREQSGLGTHVFDVATGFKGAWVKLLKRARITHFRWHDLRHHFASRLVQHGVPLNTVRDLLGLSAVQMSLRYAHLATDQRRVAVAKLNEKPLLALTLRLPWEGMPPTWRYPIDFMVEREGLEPSTPAL